MHESEPQAKNEHAVHDLGWLLDKYRHAKYKKAMNAFYTFLFESDVTDWGNVKFKSRFESDIIKMFKNSIKNKRDSTMKDQVNVQEVMSKISENPDLYYLDLAIDYYESYLDTTTNQVNHLNKECKKVEQIVQSLVRLRNLAIENPPKEAEFQKI